jgi:hypothetical protein
MVIPVNKYDGAPYVDKKITDYEMDSQEDMLSHVSGPLGLL